MPTLAVLSSTDEILGANSNYTKHFLPTLDTSVMVLSPVSARGDYDKDSQGNIKSAANQLSKTADLIVTVGGIVSAAAVASLNPNQYTMPFLVLVGRSPTPDSSLRNTQHLIGGVDLDTTPQRNQERGQLLLSNYAGAGVNDITKICLLYNVNSNMGDEEAWDWKFHGGFVQASSVDQKNYDPAAFNNDFNVLIPRLGPVQAVIVSGDPFFTWKASDITRAATTWNKPVCYPNEVYAATAQHGTSMVYGASLADAYTALATKANLYLRNPNPSNPPQLGVAIQPQVKRILIKHKHQ